MLDVTMPRGLIEGDLLNALAYRLLSGQVRGLEPIEPQLFDLGNIGPAGEGLCPVAPQPCVGGRVVKANPRCEVAGDAPAAVGKRLLGIHSRGDRGPILRLVIHVQSDFLKHIGGDLAHDVDDWKVGSRQGTVKLMGATAGRSGLWRQPASCGERRGRDLGPV